MVNNFLKGLGLSFLGLVLCLIFSTTAASNSSAYGPHVILGLSFTLMIFGPILFWIVYPLKERSYDKGKKKRFYAIMAPIGFLFLICLGAAFMPPAPPVKKVTLPPIKKVTATIGEVIDLNLQTSVNVTLEGAKDFYTMTMTGPEGTEVDSKFIPETQMADGKESVWMKLAFKSEEAAKPGIYLLAVTDSFGRKVAEKSFGPFSGANLSVIHVDIFATYEILGYDIHDLNLKVKNDGDLPAYVSRVDVEIDTREKSSVNIPEEEKVILPGETATITASSLSLPMIYIGVHTVSIKLREGSSGEGKIVAIHTSKLPLYPSYFF